MTDISGIQELDKMFSQMETLRIWSVVQQVLPLIISIVTLVLVVKIYRRK